MQRAWVMLALTMVIVAFALSTGFPMFHRAYYVFGLLLIFSALWVWLLVQGIHVDVRRPVLRSRAGGEIEEKITVYRRNPFLRGFVEIQEQTDMSIAPPGAVISMGSADMTALDLKVPCPRRGIFKVGPIRVAGSDPFGLFRLRRSVGESHKVIVHPDTLELPGFHILPAELPGEGARHLRSQSVTTSAFGIRDYQFGDSLNRISWKATAHHNALMVKEFEVEPANTTWVLVDMERRGPYWLRRRGHGGDRHIRGGLYMQTVPGLQLPSWLYGGWERAICHPGPTRGRADGADHGRSGGSTRSGESFYVGPDR